MKCAAKFLYKILLSTNFLILSDHFSLKHQICINKNDKQRLYKNLFVSA